MRPGTISVLTHQASLAAQQEITGRGGRVPAHSVILCVQQRNSVHAHSAAGLATESFADHAVLLAVFAACATQAFVLPSRPAAVVTWCSAVSVPAVSMTSPRRRRR